MASNYVTDAGSGGNTFKSTEDGSTIHWPAASIALDNSGTPVFAPGDGTDGLLVNLGSNNDVVVTNGGTFAVQVDGDALTALQLIDDAVYADDADWTDGTSKHMLIGGLYQSSPQSITDGDVGPLQVTANGYLITSINGTVTVDASGTTVPVSNAALTELAAAINTNRVDVNLAASGATVTVDGSGVTQPVSGTVTANLSATDNAVLDAIQAAVEGTLTVGSHAVTNAGTFAVQVDGSALTALQLIDDPVFADDAAFTIGTSKVNMAGATVDDTSTDTADEGDAVALRATADRRLIGMPYESHANLVDGTGNATGTSNTSVIAAQGAGIRTYVTSIQVTNASATDSEVIIKDGTTEKTRITAPANAGAIIQLPVPLRGSANTAWQFASADSVTTMYVAMQGYKSNT